MTTNATTAGEPTLRRILAEPKLLAILVLGAASGFPNQITESTLQAWLKDAGESNTTIGILTYVAIPYLLKFLWAPLLDRYPLPLLGRRRGWIAATQFAIAAATAVLAFQDPAGSLAMVATCAVVIVLFSASQDIVIDAYKVDVAQPAERGLIAAAANLGYRASSWFAFAFALVIADAFGWRVAFLALAVVMLAFTAGTILAPEPDRVQSHPATLRESVATPLRELFGSPGAAALIVLVMLFKIGDAFALKLFTPFMMDVGFTKTEIGLIAKVIMTSGTIFGAILGGLWMVRLGLLRAMLLFGVLQAVSNLAYLALALVGKSYPVMVFAVAVDNLASGMGNVATVALIMAICNVRFSAFQYALLSSLALLPRYALGGPAGWIADHWGWGNYYIVSFVIALPGLACVWAMRDRVRAFG
ncbi:MAG: MFS transporter [Steroidobacteraceae bacterium]